MDDPGLIGVPAELITIVGGEEEGGSLKIKIIEPNGRGACPRNRLFAPARTCDRPDLCFPFRLAVLAECHLDAALVGAA